MRRWDLVRFAALAGLALAAWGAMLGIDAVKSGIYNVSASKPHTKLGDWVLHETMINSVRLHARSVDPPARFTPAQVNAGFCLYESHCVACHGAAGVARQQWVNGMNPPPPYLVDAPDRWTTSQLFWIVSHGIKMTGMPSWRQSLSQPEIWSVVAFIEASREMPPQTYANWRAGRRCGRAAPRSFAGQL